MSYNVYRVAFIGVPRNHHTVFVETDEDGPGTGYIYQVTGNIQSGMKHGHKKARKPEESATFVDKEYLGTVTIDDYPRMADVCNDISPPRKQFEMNKRLYPDEKIRRCQEWTEEAIEALTQAGVLQKWTTTSLVQEEEGSKYWGWDEIREEWYHNNDNGTFEVKVQQGSRSKDWVWDKQQSRWYFNNGNGTCTVKYDQGSSSAATSSKTGDKGRSKGKGKGKSK